MKRLATLLAPALALTQALAIASPALAQPVDLPIAPATTRDYPPGVRVTGAGDNAVYADRRGLVLYGMDMRTMLRWAPDPALYCKDACADEWEPLLAPADAKPNIAFPQGFGDRGRKLPEGFVNPQTAPDWTVIQGAQGPQWVYKGWHLVFIRKGDRPGDTSHDGLENRSWNTLKFVPPQPAIIAPPNVSTVFAGGAWSFADSEGRVLFTGTCKHADCTAWVPFGAGLASRGVGAWKVGSAGATPQWLYKGKPVYVSRDDDPLAAPATAKLLRP